jgi:anthranilate phosphoribosyltransferase
VIKEAIGTLVAGRSLTREEAALVMAEIMDGQATPAQLGSFLTTLRMKGETTEEIIGFASVMRARAVPVFYREPVIDIVGTGGDGAGTFNISTAAAFVAAGAGLRVAKHGNRAASGQCGSADVLEALGVKIELGAAGVQRCLDEVGIGFLFAPVFHPAMKFAAGTRREIGIRTVFNVLGPLVNPAGAQYLVVGVAGTATGEQVAPALRHLGARHALVVYGLDGIDEISIAGPSEVWEVGEAGLSRSQVSPEEFGFTAAPRKAIAGGTPAENAVILRAVLGGERSPRRDVVLMNAAAALMASEKAGTFREGAKLAAQAVDSGRALEKLERLIELSGRLGGAR